MAASAPIAQMSAPELRRSLLMQIVGLRELVDKLVALDLAVVPQNEVDRLFLAVTVREGNYEQTLARIEELAA